MTILCFDVLFCIVNANIKSTSSDVVFASVVVPQRLSYSKSLSVDQNASIVAKCSHIFQDCKVVYDLKLGEMMVVHLASWVLPHLASFTHLHPSPSAKSIMTLKKLTSCI